MTEREILLACSGVTEDEQPRARMLLETKYVDLKDGTEVTVSEKALFGPVLNFFRNARHMNVDVCFPSATDPELLDVVEMLKAFSTPEHSMDIADSTVPLVQLTVMPEAYHGEYFAAGWNSSWVLMPSQMNRLPDTVRFIYDNDDFHTYRSTLAELTVEELEELLLAE